MRGQRTIRADPWLLVLVPAYVLALLVSWGRWTDPLVDFGRQLYVPWRLVEGEVLYRDIAHVFGPLAAHLNAVVFAVLGVSMQSLVAFNLVLIGAYAGLLHLAFGSWFGRVAGVVAPLLFLLVFAFPQYIFQANYNFVTPYSYDLSYGVMLATLCLYFVLGGAGGADVSPRRLFAGGVVAGAVLLTKPEIVFALGGALSVACMPLPGAVRIRRAGLAALVAGTGVLPVLAYLHFARVMAPSEAAQAALGALVPLGAGRMATSPYYEWVSGLDAPARNVSLMLALSLPWLLATWIGMRVRIGSWGNAPWPRVLACVVVVCAPLLLVRALGQVWIVDNAARALPLLMAGVICIICRERNALATGQYRGRLVIGVFAFLLLAKLILNTHFFHYGFALAMPAALVVAAAIVADWPGRGPGLVAARLLPGILGLSVVLAHLAASAAHYSLRNAPLELGTDTLRVFDPVRDPRSAYAGAFAQWGRSTIPEDATLLVLPDAAMLNFAVRRAAGVPNYSLPRPELEHYGEDAVLQAFREHAPDYIAIVDQRPGFFGAWGAPGYGEHIMQWVNRDYSPVARFSHDASGNAGLVVLARRPGGP